MWFLSVSYSAQGIVGQGLGAEGIRLFNCVGIYMISILQVHCLPGIGEDYGNGMWLQYRTSRTSHTTFYDKNSRGVIRLSCTRTYIDIHNPGLWTAYMYYERSNQGAKHMESNIETIDT